MSLESAIDAGRTGLITEEELVRTFASASLVYVGQLADDDDPSSFQPLVLAPQSEDGEAQAMVVLYTDPTIIPEEVSAQGTMLLQATGASVVESLPEGLGIAINPGAEPNMELPASSIAAVKEVIASQE